ncbi:adenine-specific DNA methyltransferase [Mycobacteroides abscessus subsp. massiliense]|uniref:MT-A70 family methyltransferase n=1 Tax=Mycobacteroides abscessus TaxID=36809 RepID=UPI0009D3951C|nr:MT-A70 family methyltransferase [Mycobacteroides abscessus]SKM24268.1 Transcriptional activator, adenine-specific DNA methyltransferase [Mycobacteroides abscessus subsp. massiliense]SKM72174.1 adenine-specific DNA methyltransferase [Mycobacteroides abscessus subsp. massiliense]SKN08573.1 adenine-specific DNA methyltransferase [Mycobacteroides abscessus subsp. massiliense]SKN16469.1 adenine-specific DNA methyltransferase [Mycobacteroides abscessus subsp. massiliense]SKN26391.1 adenine-specif
MTLTDPMDDIKPLRAAPLREASEPPPLPTVEGGWKTILADPPWRFTNRTGKVAPEHRRLDRYSTLDVDAICDIPVSQVAARDAHLYLWVPNALLPDGIRVMQAWGYRYVSNVIWAKRRKDGGPDGRGVGFYFRNVTEIILFGVRGSMRTLPHARSQVNMIETRKREHSRKPDEQYAFIEACSPGPYLELFSRHPQPGWSGWGDEAGEDVVPRGRVHKGYGGGAIEVPAVTKHVRLDPATRERVGKEMRILYESGKSIRQIVDETGYSITRVRRLLENAGTTFRTQGSH